MKTVAFLPVKGSSERIRNKNTALLDGKPLFLHTLEKLMRCPFIDEVFLDTEKDEIYEAAKHTNCAYLKRDPDLATNKTDGHSLFYNEAKKTDADIYIQILGTSPFIKPSTIERGVNILKEQGDIYDSVILVRNEKQYTWSKEGPDYDRTHIPNSKDLPDTTVETMGLYMTNRDVALNMKRRYGIKPYLLEADPIEAVDVNYPSDFELAEVISKGLKSSENRRLGFLKKFVNSAMLSDVLDDIGLHDSVITGLECNIGGTKVFGRARTLKIRRMEKGEDFKGIYDALKSYAEISDNDIIVVENECPDYAYFGELNTMLSIRAGASATIVGGATRDRDNVMKMNYPVFSKGYNCKDVRKHATLASFNRTINVLGVTVSPSDLIFADNDGVVVIPVAYEDRIMKAIIEKAGMENSVAGEIARYSDPLDIVARIGAF